MITYDDFAKVEIKVGKVLSAEKIPDTDKLLKLSVDFGPIVETIATAAVPPVPQDPAAPAAAVALTETKRDVRQIVSGIALYFPEAQTLVGKKCMFVTNLEPRKIKGYDSDGMLFAVSTADGKFSLLEPSTEIPEGTKAK